MVALFTGVDVRGVLLSSVSLFPARRDRVDVLGAVGGRGVLLFSAAMYPSLWYLPKPPVVSGCVAVCPM